ncbi:MAG: phosphotransferase [Alphaproteobacteria bacterium]|nr:phosphotransferase [Alphaproteobacteria bacterium]
MPDRTDPPLATGATAEVLAWKDGQVIKLFRERASFHGHELAATRAASASGLAVPAVIGGLVEVEDREGIVFERVDGPTMAGYVEDHPDEAVGCAVRMADLHAEIHRRDVSGIVELGQILTWAIDRADALALDTRKAVLGILDRLPGGSALCHGDFHPHNIIMGASGPVAIDWAMGARGNALADFARAWLISRLWLSDVGSGKPKQCWKAFWPAYSRRYRDLIPCPDDELADWRIVTAAASLGLDGSLDWIQAATALRRDFVHAMLNDETHPWTA